MTNGCPECHETLVRVDGVPDPRSALVVFTASPCGHPLGLHEFQAALLAGVPGAVVPVTGATLIGAERQRQMTEEGYTPEGDARLTGGELAWAPWTLLDRVARPDQDDEIPAMWPKRLRWPGAKTALRLLIIAGSFIAAEIDRRLANGERP